MVCTPKTSEAERPQYFAKNLEVTTRHFQVEHLTASYSVS